MELACGQYGDVVPSLVVAAKSRVYAEYQNVSSASATAAAAAAVNEKPINSLKVSHPHQLSSVCYPTLTCPRGRVVNALGRHVQ